MPVPAVIQLIGSAVPAVTVTLAQDSFDRADSTTTLGNADSGQTWVEDVGQWGINGNAAYRSTATANDIATVNVGTPDQLVTVTLSVNQNASGALGRYTDGNNFYLAQQSSTNNIQLYKKVAGAFTQLGSTVSIGTWVNGDEIAVYCNGTSIQARYNGATIISVTDSALATGNFAGLRQGSAAATTARFDDFLVTAP